MAIEKTTLLIITMLIIPHTLTLNQDTDQSCGNVIKIDNYSLEKRINTTQTGIVYDMNIHWKTGRIYFAFLNKGIRSLKVMKPGGIVDTIGIRYPTTVYVDNKHDSVYLGSQECIYKYNIDAPYLRYAAEGTYLVSMVATNDNKHMFITTSSNEVRRITPMSDEIDDMQVFQAIPNGNKLVIDAMDNIYFVQNKTSYMLKNGDNNQTRIKDLPEDEIVTHFVSSSGLVYAMDVNSNIYLVDAENASARILGSFNVSDVTTFALDADDNIWIGIPGAILKFKKSEVNPCL